MTKEFDLVDRIFAILKLQMPDKEVEAAKAAVREELGGQPGIFKGSTAARKAKAREVLCHFDGRNASTVARQLGVSRGTVYRWLKQPGMR